MEMQYFLVLFLGLFHNAMSACDDNKSRLCRAYSLLGWCKTTSSNYLWMTANCRKTCGFSCPTTAAPPTTTASNCIDENPLFCSSVVGKCNDDNYKDYAATFCKKTCGLCGTDSIKTTSSAPNPNANQCGIRGDGNTRIVGGTNAKPGDWPWQVQVDLLGHYGRYWCGGTLLNDEWILSAAHCFEDYPIAKKYNMYLGEHDIRIKSPNEQKMKVEKIIMHPSYDPSTMTNDLALIKLSSKVTFNKYVRPACFPDKSTSFPVGEECYVTGWGALQTNGASPRILQQAKIPLVSQSECKKAMGAGGGDINDSMFCAGYDIKKVDSCQGDSGGPLVCKKQQNGKDTWYLWGVVSWGYDCAAPGEYGVYASTSQQQLNKWVVDNVFKS